MQELVQLTWVFSRGFSASFPSSSMLDGSTGTVKHWKWCTWHRKASAKNSSKLNKFLHSVVNLLIQHIIVQDQDGQNNNTILFYRYSTKIGIKTGNSYQKKKRYLDERHKKAKWAHGNLIDTFQLSWSIYHDNISMSPMQSRQNLNLSFLAQGYFRQMVDEHKLWNEEYIHDFLKIIHCVHWEGTEN